MIGRPKQPRLENPHLLLMARRELRPCLLGIPGVCPTEHHRSIAVQCCACHGNSSIFNKGGHIKAHDFFTVWGCARCHTWLDESYTASGDERQKAFLAALELQIDEWVILALEPMTTQKDCDAVTWALEHLSERGYAKITPERIAHAR